MTSTAERQLAAEQLAEIRNLAQTMTQWSARWAGRITNDTLEVATVIFDATGVVTRNYGASIGSIEVTNLSTAVPATVTNIEASNTFVAAAPGTVALAVNGASITGFTVAFQAPASAVSGVITVTNVDSSTMSYPVTIPTTGLVFEVTYPNPLPAASAGVAPTVNVPAIATGPAYGITVTGQNTVAATPAHSMTISPGGPLAAVPTAGIGVFVVPAGASHTVALVSRQFTIYGTQGDTVSFQVFTAGVQPTTV